jgi:DNA polymerase
MHEARMTHSSRVDYLAAMGLQSWVLRARAPAHAAAATAPSPPAQAAAATAPSLPAQAAAATAPAPPAATGPALPVRAHVATAALRDIAPRESTGRPVSDREAAYEWAPLRERVAACTRCGLSASRTQTVFGVGNTLAEWLVVGEAPGAEEDRRGEPFVGPAGQLLNSMLRAIGLSREQVFIANVLKCRPPNNRDPQAAEVAECMPFLERQIALLKPKIMLVVGRIAAQSLLQSDLPLGRLRRQVHQFGAARVPVVVTYHPAYLLRTPTEKRKAWEDLKFAREVLARG